MRIAFGTDDHTAVTEGIIDHLRADGHEVVVVADPDRWGAAGRLVGEAVVSGAASLGIVCCFTGTGVSIAANKVDGVRAALCGDAYTATGARRWNDANVLALSLRLTTATVATEIVDAFVSEVAVDPEQADVIATLER